MEGRNESTPPFQHDAPQAATPTRRSRLSREREAEAAAPRLLPLAGRLRTPYLSSGREARLASGEKDISETLLVLAFLAGRFALTFPSLSS